MPKNEAWGPEGPSDPCLAAAGKGSQLLSRMAEQGALHYYASRNEWILTSLVQKIPFYN